MALVLRLAHWRRRRLAGDLEVFSRCDWRPTMPFHFQRVKSHQKATLMWTLLYISTGTQIACWNIYFFM